MESTSEPIRVLATSNINPIGSPPQRERQGVRGRVVRSVDPEVIENNLTVQCDGNHVAAVGEVITKVKGAWTVSGAKIFESKAIREYGIGGEPGRNNGDGTG